MKRVVAAVLVLSGLLSGCGSSDSEVDYHAEMRDIDAFADATDDELDDVAATSCQYLAETVDAGASNGEAFDAVYRVWLGAGLSDADALRATVTIVGTHCPIDIAE